MILQNWSKLFLCVAMLVSDGTIIVQRVTLKNEKKMKSTYRLHPICYINFFLIPFDTTILTKAHSDGRITLGQILTK